MEAAHFVMIFGVQSACMVIGMLDRLLLPSPDAIRTSPMSAMPRLMHEMNRPSVFAQKAVSDGPWSRLRAMTLGFCSATIQR